MGARALSSLTSLDVRGHRTLDALPTSTAGFLVAHVYGRTFRSAPAQLKSHKCPDDRYRASRDRTARRRRRPGARAALAQAERLLSRRACSRKSQAKPQNRKHCGRRPDSATSAAAWHEQVWQTWVLRAAATHPPALAPAGTDAAALAAERHQCGNATRRPTTRSRLRDVSD